MIFLGDCYHFISLQDLNYASSQASYRPLSRWLKATDGPPIPGAHALASPAINHYKLFPNLFYHPKFS